MITISNLRDVPHFADTIASRGWHAWWTDSGVPLSDYRSNLEPMLADTDIPQAFVAHEGDTYCGSALLIACDLDARAHYTPWIAALWVDEEFRMQGLAARLMDKAQSTAMELGHTKVYLCAEAKMTPYYLAQAWLQIETDVNGLNVFERVYGSPFN